MNEEILKAVDEIADEMIEGIKRIVRIDSVESEAVNDAPFGEGVRHALDETLQLSRDLGLKQWMLIIISVMLVMVKVKIMYVPVVI